MSESRRVFHVAHLFDGAGPLLTDCELYLERGRLVRILEAGADAPEDVALRRAFDDADHVRIPDGLVLPGLVNAHHHVYSALARGLPVDEPLPDFPAILERLWWRLDRALDEESIRLSALVTAIESVHHGVTTIVDHHSSPSRIPGSLELVAGELGELGLTRVLCYETTDRNGPEALDAAIAENLAFAERCAGDPDAAALFGLHASFTLSDDSLARIAAEKPASLPIHVHVAEDRCDVDHARELGYAGPLARLDRFGLLGEDSLLAHGVHLSDEEHALVRDRGAVVAHNPESNLNNRVGYADLDRMPVERILLGTDGMSSNVLGSLRSAFLLYTARGGGARDAFELCHAMGFANPAAYLSRLLGRPVGRIVEGEPADLAIFAYPAPTPLTADNLTAHLLYGLGGTPRAAWVYARGAPVLEDGELSSIDEAAIRERAREHGKALWRRYEAIR